MLTALIALICELGWVALRWFLRLNPDHPLCDLLADLLMFSALVIGVVGLVLTPVVLRSRRVLPPRGVTLFAVIVAAAPLVALLLRLAG